MKKFKKVESKRCSLTELTHLTHLCQLIQFTQLTQLTQFTRLTQFTQSIDNYTTHFVNRFMVSMYCGLIAIVLIVSSICPCFDSIITILTMDLTGRFAQEKLWNSFLLDQQDQQDQQDHQNHQNHQQYQQDHQNQQAPEPKMLVAESSLSGIVT